MSHQSGKPGSSICNNESGRHDRPVFLTQRVSQRKQEFVFGPVVFVEDKVVEPAGRQYRDERLLDRGTRARDRRLEGVELAVDGFGPLRFDRAAGDDPHGDRRHRLLAGDQEQGSGPVAIGIEIGEFVALAGRVADGRRLLEFADLSFIEAAGGEGALHIWCRRFRQHLCR
jgi:hypothetical protein